MAGANEQQHIPGPLSCFITLPDEKLILAERRHWIVLSTELTTIIVMSFPFYIVLYIVFVKLIHHPTLFISGVLVVASSTISLFVKTIIDWYFHLFIVTNRKILEVWFSPLFFYKINGVLLDQVRCTEIDEKKHGIMNELVDVGDIIITFDRPTHQEEFVLTAIKNPRKVAMLLSDMFSNLQTNPTTAQPVWYHTSQNSISAALNKQIKGRFSLGGR